ncbi:hypothetical protein DL1_03245 [Thioclava dalianensis]|uniref:HTH cro/C1-type domain-containing protein n=1 Tax=Thioclava dalianensis TaxID=1185766 RepID=A0A074TD75_9RHOB|nr:hypothetical protein [Thioclava dalianensis]KEP69654.1 hypothetical protein DL1_03245 [Thioclava dalianensis]SFN15944.1 hypothetical protein SAMN05216224_102711 [Thioclava dalianensis]
MSVERFVSQAELARELGVSRAAVSQWKAKDILRDDAFSEPGKSGKIILSVAIAQVRRNRDVGQSLGNGIATRTAVEADPPEVIPEPPEAQPSLPMRAAAPVAETAPASAAGPKVDRIEDQLKRAKLEEQLRRNRIQAAEEAARQGQLMAAEDAREQMARIAGMMLQIFEGALPDFASAMAAQFDLPQRDVLHLLRAEFKKVRKTASMKERMRADTVERAVTALVDLEV